jgi:hypothetical protein
LTILIAMKQELFPLSLISARKRVTWLVARISLLQVLASTTKLLMLRSMGLIARLLDSWQRSLTALFRAKQKYQRLKVSSKVQMVSEESSGTWQMPREAIFGAPGKNKHLNLKDCTQTWKVWGKIMVITL